MSERSDVVSRHTVLGRLLAGATAPFRSLASSLGGGTRAAGTALENLLRTGAGSLLLSRPVLGLAGLTVLAGGALGGHAVLTRQLSRLPAHAVDVRCLEINDRPPWLDEDWAATIRNPFGNRRRINLFEPGVVRKIHDAYAECPWIEEVSHVRKDFPNRLAIKIRVRRPAVAVWRKNAYVLVDRTGVVLPRRFRAVPDFGFNVLVADGVKGAPPPAGHRWESPQVGAAVALSRILTEREDAVLDRVARVDVSHVTEGGRSVRSEVMLFAREGGGRVEWGTAPTRPNPLEIPVERKVENLKRLFAAFGDMRDLEYALIHFKDVVVLPKSRATVDRGSYVPR